MDAQNIASMCVCVCGVCVCVCVCVCLNYYRTLMDI